jgi:hypothetical protein
MAKTRAAAPKKTRTQAPRRAPRTKDPLPRLRELCLALPGVTERLSHGEPTWFVKKSFVMYSDHHHDDRVAFVCAGADGAQEVLVATQPSKFYRPPYVGHLGWIGVYLDVPGADWNQIADLVLDAYRQVAPRKLLEQLDRD